MLELLTITEVGTGAQTTESDLVDEIDVSRIHLNNEREATPETTEPSSTLFPKITGRVDDLIENYTYKFGTDKPLIKLTGTVKLHGTHADIVIEPDHSIRIQSRNRLSLDIEHDNYNVAARLLPLRKEILELKDRVKDKWHQLNGPEEIDEQAPIIIAGEWIGPGVQKKVAIASLPQRCFVILAISVNGEWQDDEGFAKIHNEAAGIYNISRGGFYREILDFKDKETLDRCKEKIMAHTLEVEKECPFAKSFSVSGVGEGIVWKAHYPLSQDPRFWLKTKGPEHRHTQTDRLKKDQLKNGAGERAKTFAEAAVGDMRLQQAWDFLGEMGVKRDKSATQAFNQWLVKDVEVEEKKIILEMEVDKMALKKAIGVIGRIWYFKKLGEM
jgi:RNA ligase